MRGLSYILKDERSLCKIQGDVYGMQGKFELKLKNFFFCKYSEVVKRSRV